MGFTFATEDPRTPDVKSLLQRHLDFCHEVTPAEHSFALDVEKLREPGITLFGCREDGELLGVGALKDLGDGFAELKSMHTAQAARGKGVGSAMVKHLLAHAHSNGVKEVLLETGSHPPYEAARRLYRGLGFTPTGPFGDYSPSEFNTFMKIEMGEANF